MKEFINLSSKSTNSLKNKNKLKKKPKNKNSEAPLKIIFGKAIILIMIYWQMNKLFKIFKNIFILFKLDIRSN